jgi:hypothetical protein
LCVVKGALRGNCTIRAERRGLRVACVRLAPHHRSPDFHARSRRLAALARAARRAGVDVRAALDGRGGSWASRRLPPAKLAIAPRDVCDDENAMSSDMHAFVEVDTLTPALRAWCFAEIHFRRDIELFNIVGAVKDVPADGLPPVAAVPRGLPERVSATLAKHVATATEERKGRPPEASWFGVKDLSIVQARYRAVRRSPNSDLTALVALFRALDPDEADRCRLVFWF